MTRPEKVKLEYCPNCKLRSLFWNQTRQIWECLNPECQRIYTSKEFSEYWYNKAKEQPVRQGQAQQNTQLVFNAPLWLVNILESKRLWKLLICSAVVWWCWTAIQYSGNSPGLAFGLALPILLLYIIRLLLKKFTSNYIVLVARHHLSQIFHSIRKSSFLRFAIILTTIALLVTTIWSMVAFIYQLPVASSAYLYLLNMLIIIIAQIWLLSWLCGMLKHSRQISNSPKFAIVFWSLLGIAIFCAFVGISPFSDIKDNATASITDWWEHINQTTTVTNPPIETKTPQPVLPITPHPTIPKPIPLQPTISNLKDPTWNQLLEFLRGDNTDAHPYTYPTFVCANFAKMLQSNAHKSGWKCAIVDVQLSGYPDFYHYGIPSNTSHSCNAFNTTDRGLVYIDCTRAAQSYGPANQDNTVNIEVGQEYIPRALFPTYGWRSASLSMGIVVSVSDPQW
jgi:hypothetical protein